MRIKRKVKEYCIHDYKYTNCLYKSSVEPFMEKRKLYRGITQKKCVVSSRGTPKYLILVIRRKGGNIMHNAIFLHAATVTEKVHFINLLLILCLQLFLLSDKPNL